MVTCSKDGALMRPEFNCSVVPGYASGGKSIFTLNMLFLSKLDSIISLTGADVVLTIQLKGSGRTDIGMALSNFVEVELDI